MPPQEDSLSGTQHHILTASCGAALAGLAPVALYQLGAIGHLPDPPCGWFDSDRITSSKTAHPFGIPDSLLGMASYGATMALILAADRSVPGRRVLGAKLCLDGAVAGFNCIRQIVSFRSLCSWCMVTAAATAAMVYAGRHLLEATAAEAAGRVKANIR